MLEKERCRSVSAVLTPRLQLCLTLLQVHPYSNDQLAAAIGSVAAGVCGIGDAIGPAVGCLMATFGTSLITDCIFDFEDPEQLQNTPMQQRLELWGLQVSCCVVVPCHLQLGTNQQHQWFVPGSSWGWGGL